MGVLAGSEMESISWWLERTLGYLLATTGRGISPTVRTYFNDSLMLRSSSILCFVFFWFVWCAGSVLFLKGQIFRIMGGTLITPCFAIRSCSG